MAYKLAKETIKLQNSIIITYYLTESLLTLLKQESTSINEVTKTSHNFLDSRIKKKNQKLLKFAKS